MEDEVKEHEEEGGREGEKKKYEKKGGRGI